MANQTLRPRVFPRMCKDLFWFLVLAGLVSYAQDRSPLSPEEQAWQVLHDGLKETKATKRLEAVKALSLLSGNHQAVRLTLRALHDPNYHVRAAACTTLGQLQDPAAIPGLRQALSDKEPAVVLAAAYSLFLFKDKSAYGVYYAVLMGDRKTSGSVIEAQLERLKDPKQMAQMGVQEGLGFVPYAGMGMEAYRTLAKHDGSPVRAAAARFLAHDPDPISEDALVQTALSDSSRDVRQAALDALADRGDPLCAKRLLKNLDDSNDAVRYRTAATILRIGRSRMRIETREARR